MPSGSTSPRPEPATARLFVALWPAAEVRAALAAYRDRWRWPPAARPVADQNLHATLHFIGGFARERITEMRTSLAAVQVEAPTLQASSAEIWRGGIAVLTLHGDPRLLVLHERVGAALAGLGLALDERPFTAHVTLARKAQRAAAPASLPRVEWRATVIALVESVAGQAPYRVLQTWQLQVV
jgi:2'-5' RNA ligase